MGVQHFSDCSLKKAVIYSRERGYLSVRMVHGGVIGVRVRAETDRLSLRSCEMSDQSYLRSRSASDLGGIEWEFMARDLFPGVNQPRECLA